VTDDQNDSSAMEGARWLSDPGGFFGLMIGELIGGAITVTLTLLALS
jgi:hypothetical protein